MQWRCGPFDGKLASVSDLVFHFVEGAIASDGTIGELRCVSKDMRKR
jgi:hypothetical protein